MRERVCVCVCVCVCDVHSVTGWDGCRYQMFMYDHAVTERL